jgi:hypothetical protein
MSDEEKEIVYSPEQLGLKKFQTLFRAGPNGSFEKAVYIDGEELDWKIDISSFKDAMRMGPMFKREIQRDIELHFVESVSDFLGRKVTIDDIKKAIKTGWI